MVSYMKIHMYLKKDFIILLGPCSRRGIRGKAYQRYPSGPRLIQSVSGIITWSSPHKQVKFRIDLILGVVPIAKEPYHLAPSEMQEFSKKLQELLDKWFIRPSSSP